MNKTAASWTWPNTDGAGKVGVTTWSVNPAKSIQMNKAGARLNRVAKENVNLRTPQPEGETRKRRPLHQ